MNCALFAKMDQIFSLTRMHSSRMHTACSSSCPGGSQPGTLPPGTRHPPGDQAHSGTRHPPVNRMTNRCKILPCLKLRLQAVKIHNIKKILEKWQKILEKSGKFVSPEKWKPCLMYENTT